MGRTLFLGDEVAEIKTKRGRNACFGDEVAKGMKCLFRERSDSDGDEMTVFWGTKWQGDEMTLNLNYSTQYIPR